METWRLVDVVVQAQLPVLQDRGLLVVNQVSLISSGTFLVNANILPGGGAGGGGGGGCGGGGGGS